MKNLFFICLLTIAVVGCKKETKKGTPELFRGEFIYTADAAVLKGEDYIYGVALDAKAEELAKKVEPLKREDFDMVPVVIMAIKKPNPNEEGWEEILEIVEIVGVTEPTSDLATKINTNKDGEEGGENLLSLPPEPEKPPVIEESESDHSSHNH